MEAPVALALDLTAQPCIQVLVNFGLFTGRDPSRGEVDRLLTRLHERLDRVTVTSQQRYEELGEGQMCLHEVLISIPEQTAVEAGYDHDVLRRLVVADAEQWVEECRAQPEGALTLAERLGTATVELVPDPRNGSTHTG
jgi:hypothetical protein